MDQQGHSHDESNGLGTFGKVKEGIKDQVHKMKSKLHHHSDDGGVEAETSQEVPSEQSNGASSNYEDLPYDGTGRDRFTQELASLPFEQKDEVGSPSSLDSGRHSFTSGVSGLSWTSTQKTIAGLGVDEPSSQEVLGPYKRIGSVQALEAVPTEYRDYANNRNRDDGHSSGHVSSSGSPTHASTQSVSSSLYNDLSSISERDFQVPEGIIKVDGFDCEFDKESSLSPRNTVDVEHGVSNMKLNGPAD